MQILFDRLINFSFYSLCVCVCVCVCVRACTCICACVFQVGKACMSEQHFVSWWCRQTADTEVQCCPASAGLSLNIAPHNVTWTRSLHARVCFWESVYTVCVCVCVCVHEQYFYFLVLSVYFNVCFGHFCLTLIYFDFSRRLHVCVRYVCVYTFCMCVCVCVCFCVHLPVLLAEY